MISAQKKLDIRLFIAKWLIRFNRLKPADYTGEELCDLVSVHLPITFPVSVPTGEGSFTLMSADVCMPPLKSVVAVNLLSSFSVEYHRKPLYRAHLEIAIEGKPLYDISTKEIRLTDVVINEIRLLQDEYSLLNDTRDLINLVVPNPVLSMFSDTLKNALDIVTGGSANDATAYLQLYAGGSKQRLLDFHKPQIQEIIIDLIAQKESCYPLDLTVFEEQLFSKWGKEVIVEEGKLRFKF